MYPAGIFYSHLTNNEENMLLKLLALVVYCPHALFGVLVNTIGEPSSGKSAHMISCARGVVNLITQLGESPE
jgi:hypothetical protein